MLQHKLRGAEARILVVLPQQHQWGVQLLRAMNTTSTTSGGDQAIGKLAIHIQEACLAAQNNDIPGVLLHLNLALDTLNALRSEAATNATAAPEGRALILEGGPEGGEVGSEGGAEIEG